MSDSTIEIHPFDVTRLEKGDWILPDRCETVLGVGRNDKRYALKLLGVAQELERQWMDLRDEQVTICCEKDGLRICTDDKAVEVNRQRRQSAINSVERAQVRQSGVDAAKLTSPELQRLHEREMVLGAAWLLGGRKAARAALKPYRRNTPTLGPGKK